MGAIITAIKRKKGIVYLVGAGPGDPELLTLRGARLLAQADAVVYDGLVNPALLELAPRAERIYAGKIKPLPEKIWEGSRNHKCVHLKNAGVDQTNQLLVKLAGEGKRVVRLKGGDPFIFGRGGEEASCLKKHRIDFEVVPGITAGYSAPAYAGIPVTDRRFSSLVIFATAHEDPQKEQSSVDWEKLAQLEGTLVTFMGVKSLPSVVQALLDGGKSPDTLISVIQWGTLPGQRVVEGSLGDIVRKVKKAGLGSPAIAVIGKVNQLRKELAWFEKLQVPQYDSSQNGQRTGAERWSQQCRL